MGTGRPRLAAAQVVFEAKRSMGGQGGGLLVAPQKNSGKPVVAHVTTKRVLSHTNSSK